MRAIGKLLRSRVLVFGVVLAVAGIAVAVAGFLAASAAASDLSDAEVAVAQIADEIAEAEKGLAEAESARETADADASEVTAQLAAAEDERSRARAMLNAVADGAPVLVEAATDLLASAGDTQTALTGLVDLRNAQVEALLASDYSGFNDLSKSYVDPAAAATARLAAFFTQVEDLPAASLRDPYRYEGPAGDAMVASEPVPLDPPTGPAAVAMTLPEEVPCASWGNEGCSYSWTATIRESNWLQVTITRIGVRYRGGGGYCVVGDEWSDVSRLVEANGSTTWSGSLIEDRDGECAPIIGGDVLVRWEGTDGEGNTLSGRATADLASPP